MIFPGKTIKSILFLLFISFFEIFADRPNPIIKKIKKKLSSENQIKELSAQKFIYYILGLNLIIEKKYEEANENLQIARQILINLGLLKTYDYMDVLNAMILAESADIPEEGDDKNYKDEKLINFLGERKDAILSLVPFIAFASLYYIFYRLI